MTEPDDDQAATPAEKHVRALVTQLRDEHADPPERLTDDVMRTARWQKVVRGTLVITGQLVGALADGVGLLLDNRRHHERRDGPA